MEHSPVQITPDEILTAIEAYGFTQFATVPCSYLKGLLQLLQSKKELLIAPNEGEALAYCIGASLSGNRAAFFIQNSGIANALSPILSLAIPFNIPFFGFVGFRGQPGTNDEPQHISTGNATELLIKTAGAKSYVLSEVNSQAISTIHRACRDYCSGKSALILVPKATISSHNTLERSPAPSCGMFPEDVLRALTTVLPRDTLFVATTGYTSREMLARHDSQNNFYMVGSMGCVSSLALGIIRSQPDKKIVVIDGDGALLMRLGSLTMTATEAPHNFLHVLLANNLYESTGHQELGLVNLDFSRIARTCGYTNTSTVSTHDHLREELIRWNGSPTLSFITVKTRMRKNTCLPRPQLTLPEIKNRFMTNFA
jgi:phosphonopyruvate decarboxylase